MYCFIANNFVQKYSASHDVTGSVLPHCKEGSSSQEYMLLFSNISEVLSSI